jgi:hypothetical protein
VAPFSAAFWLLGLFGAAPALRSSGPYSFVDRLRDALILGMAIPFVLGLIHALYAGACWTLLGICLIVAYVRHPAGPPERARASPPYLTIFALVAVAWPQLMRPLLDGDSLSYHLPNAASWVQAHSLWSVATRYWWYPPASELFASALYAVAGPFALPWSGFGSLALLGFRIVAWARSAYAAPPFVADALGAATITAYPLAIQSGTLQNDVWLAAFWLESLWLLRAANPAAVRTLAATALMKPQGWILALIALICGKARRLSWLVAAGVLGLWLVRDAGLWRQALVNPAKSFMGNLAGSTILAHGAPALVVLARVTLDASPFALVALLAALFSPWFARREGRLAWAACAAALLFFVLPFGYATSVAQLATGASLRLAAPAVAIGAVILTGPARRIAPIAAAVLLASTLFGIWYVLQIFWNDGGTHVALVFALLAVAIAAGARRLRAAWPNAAAFGLAVVAATHLASRHPLDYYNDSLRVGGKYTGVYRWIERSHSAAIGGWGLRLGVINVLSPQTRTLDLPDADPCAQARRRRVLLVAVAEGDRSAAANATRLRDALACGTVLYRDAIAVVAQP